MPVSRSFSRLCSNYVRKMSTSTMNNVEVCFIDPRSVLQGEGLQGLLKDPKQFTSLKVPSSFLPTLSNGAMELGDMDDPMNSWHFGQKDELFKYKLVGTHTTMSGFTSIIEREQLEALCEEGGAVGLPAWEDFKDDLVAGTISFPTIRAPFLFAGTVLDAPAAAVYQLVKDGKLLGVMVSSEAAE